MRKYLGLFLLALFFSADLLAQETPADSIQKPPQQNLDRQFESLFFDGIKEKAIENYDKAITIFKKCKEIKPEEGIIYVELAKSYAALENFAMAEKSFKASLKNLPEERKKPIKKNLYELYKTRQKPVEALGIAQQLNDDSYFQLEIVKIYQLMNEYDQALQELNKLEQKDPFYTEFHKYRYEIYSESNQIDQAIAHYESQMKQDDDHVWNYCKLIEFLIRDEQPGKALEIADKLDAKNTDNSMAWQCLSAFYIKADKKDKATTYVKKIVNDKYISEKVKFDILEQYRNYVAQYPELENQLISMLDNALKMEKSAASNLENAKYYEDKNPQKALKFFRLASEDQPNNFKLLKKLSLLELEFENYDEAKKVALQGQSLFPGQAVFYYVNGKASLTSENFDDAISLLQEALTYIYEDQELQRKIKQALVNAYQATGNEKRAEELLQEIKNTSR